MKDISHDVVMTDISHDVVMTDIFRKDPAYAAALPAGKGGESREVKPLWEVSPHLQTAHIAVNDGKPIDWQKNKTISAQSLFSRFLPQSDKNLTSCNTLLPKARETTMTENGTNETEKIVGLGTSAG